MAPNQTSKFIYKIKKVQKDVDAERNQPALRTLNAFLGDNNGVIQYYNGKRLEKNYVVVRDPDGNLSIAYNRAVPLNANTPIIVGYDPLKPNTFQVLGARDYTTAVPFSAIPGHHETHEWPSNDTVWVHGEQFLPGLLLANTGFVVKIYPFFFKKNDGYRGYIRGQNLDLTLYKPTLGAKAFTIAAGDDELLHVIEGNAVGSVGAIKQTDFPVILDPTMHEIWGVQLYAGQAKIRQTDKKKDVFDFRGVGSGGGGMGHIIMDPLSTIIDQKPFLEFTGNGVSVANEGQKTIVSVQQTQQYGISRWSALAGEDTFDLTDYASEILSFCVNGQEEDPLLYTLSEDGSQVLLDYTLPHNSVLTSRYLLKVL